MNKVLIIGDSNWHGSWTESTIVAFKSFAEVEVFTYIDNAPTLKNKIRDKLLQFKILKSLLNSYFSLYAKLKSFLENKTFDLVLILKGEVLTEKEISLLSKHTQNLFTWWVDDIFVYPEFVKLLPKFDHIFIFDSGYIDKLKLAGAGKVDWLPCAYNSEIYHPGESESSYECDLAFVGSYFPPREKLFHRFVDSSLKIKIWGPGWEKADLSGFFKLFPQAWQGNQLSNTEAAKLYRSAKILLNLNHSQTIYDGFNQRTFELLACGGFQLIDSRPGFEKFLKNDSDVVYFSNFEEIPELVSKYLKEPHLRKSISKSGQERVWDHHSFHNRVSTILSFVLNSN